jgi:drug/metabolite transporter (DMT)-like permease
LTLVVAATSVLDLPGTVRRGRIYIALSALAWSSAGVLQRELTVGTATQLAGRAVFAVLALFLYVTFLERGNPWNAFRAIGRPGLAIAGLMAISSASFIVALNHTTVANVLFMQALAPIMAALLGVVVLKEPVSRNTWIAMAVAIAGVALMVGGPGRPSLLGELLAFVMTLSFAVMLVITRHQREVSMAPATCLSQVIVLVLAAPFAQAGQIDGRDLALMALLGFGQIGLGLMLLSVGARLIPAAEVALISLLEIVLGPLWAWIAVSESPPAATLAGGAIVLAAVVFQARAAPEG